MSVLSSASPDPRRPGARSRISTLGGEAPCLTFCRGEKAPKTIWQRADGSRAPQRSSSGWALGDRRWTSSRTLIRLLVIPSLSARSLARLAFYRSPPFFSVSSFESAPLSLQLGAPSFHPVSAYPTTRVYPARTRVAPDAWCAARHQWEKGDRRQAVTASRPCAIRRAGGQLRAARRRRCRDQARRHRLRGVAARCADPCLQVR